jgi:hypothetical protein
MSDTKDPTYITFEWGEAIKQYALSHGVDVLDIVDPWIDHDRITPLLMQNRPDLFVYTGHGCQNFLATQNGCSLTNGFHEDVCTVQCMKPPNLKLLRDAIVVTFSCHSASQLGKCAVKYGARAYVGFNDYMMFTSDSRGSQNLFRDALLPMVLELLNGRTVGEAVDITKEALLAATKQWKPVKYLAIPMMWNHEYMEVLGDINARLGG